MAKRKVVTSDMGLVYKHTGVAATAYIEYNGDEYICFDGCVFLKVNDAKAYTQQMLGPVRMIVRRYRQDLA